MLRYSDAVLLHGQHHNTLRGLQRAMMMIGASI
jgi:hypothetical protein